MGRIKSNKEDNPMLFMAVAFVFLIGLMACVALTLLPRAVPQTEEVITDIPIKFIEFTQASSGNLDGGSIAGMGSINGKFSEKVTVVFGLKEDGIVKFYYWDLEKIEFFDNPAKILRQSSKRGYETKLRIGIPDEELESLFEKIK